jgi:hypothetical protein
VNGWPEVRVDVPDRAVRFSTLAALCEALGCQPGDLGYDG